MLGAVLTLSLVVAMDPVRIGITALLMSRARPILNLFVFWLGGMAAGFAVAAVALLWLRVPALFVMREVLSAVSGTTAAYLQVTIGVLASLIAVQIGTRKQVPARVRGGDATIADFARGASPPSSGRSIRDRLEVARWQWCSPQVWRWPRRPSSTWQR
jgi:hypothetical protein